MRRMCWSHISNFRILGPCTLFCWLSSALADPSVSLAPVPVANTTALAATASITAPPASISIDYAQLSIYNPQGLFSTLSPSLSSFCVSSVAANYSSWALNHPDVTLSTFTQAGGTYTAVSTPLFQPAYSPPCCGQCTVELHQVVSVLYWPPATEAPAVTTTVNTDGFTLTYPSVYFQLAGVFATDLCTTAIGPQISKTIIAFPPESVSTARFISTPAFPDAHYRPPPVAGYAAVDFAQYASCSAATNSAYEVATSIPVTSVVSGTTLTWNLCFPWIPVPSQMQQLVPQWSSCTLGVYPLPDPPFALTPAAGVGTLVAAMPPAALASPTPPATPNAAFAPLSTSTAWGAFPAAAPGSIQPTRQTTLPSRTAVSVSPVGLSSQTAAPVGPAGLPSQVAASARLPGQNLAPPNVGSVSGGAPSPQSLILVNGSLTLTTAASSIVFGSSILTPGRNTVVVGSQTETLVVATISANGHTGGSVMLGLGAISGGFTSRLANGTASAIRPFAGGASSRGPRAQWILRMVGLFGLWWNMWISV